MLLTLIGGLTTQEALLVAGVAGAKFAVVGAVIYGLLRLASRTSPNKLN